MAAQEMTENPGKAAGRELQRDRDGAVVLHRPYGDAELENRVGAFDRNDRTVSGFGRLGRLGTLLHRRIFRRWAVGCDKQPGPSTDLSSAPGLATPLPMRQRTRCSPLAVSGGFRLR